MHLYQSTFRNFGPSICLFGWPCSQWCYCSRTSWNSALGIILQQEATRVHSQERLCHELETYSLANRMMVCFLYFFSIGAQSTCSSLLSSWSWSSSSIEYLSCSSFFLHHWPRDDHHGNNKNQNSWNNETNGKVEEPAHKKTIFTSSFK